ncbi:MAG TPA: hydrogenase maturation protease [Anaeromyxobacter sp.]|nr:hydrogenase maturation protease [Anaeromyxobacter sp.]
MRTLVLGIGNVLLRDEGVGVHVVRALARDPEPPRFAVLEVGTAFLDALAAIEQAERIIIVDAMQGFEAPGTIYRVPFDECARREIVASMHGFDLSRVFYLAGRTSAPEVIVIGVEPALIDWGTELSPELLELVPTIMAIVSAEADRVPLPSPASSSGEGAGA